MPKQNLMTRDLVLQAGTCAWTRVVSGVPFLRKSSKSNWLGVGWPRGAWVQVVSGVPCFFTVWKKLVFPKHGVDCMVGIQ